MAQDMEDFPLDTAISGAIIAIAYTKLRNSEATQERQMSAAARAKIEEVAVSTLPDADPRRNRIPAILYRPSRRPTPYDEVQWETRTASIGNDKGSRHLRTARHRSSRRTGRRPPPTSSPANISTARWARPSARRSVAPTGPSRGRHHRRLGHERRLLRTPTQTARTSATNWPT